MNITILEGVLLLLKWYYMVLYRIDNYVFVCCYVIFLFFVLSCKKFFISYWWMLMVKLFWAYGVFFLSHDIRGPYFSYLYFFLWIKERCISHFRVYSFFIGQYKILYVIFYCSFYYWIVFFLCLSYQNTDSFTCT